jgi:hypothetical protein
MGPPPVGRGLSLGVRIDRSSQAVPSVGQALST